MEENIEIRLKTMKILQVLSSDDKNCNQMLSAECASRLVLKVNYPQPNEVHKVISYKTGSHFKSFFIYFR